jgi:acyl dehydratase
MGCDCHSLGSRVSALRDLVGSELGPSAWLDIPQERIDLFASATDDPQWIHTDPARAASGPFGTTVAHGFLTLSLCVPLLYEVLPVHDYRLTVNYGVNRVRFPAPVTSGSRIRARFRVEQVEDVAGGEQAVVIATVEREGGAKPVCVAELLLRFLEPIEEPAGRHT